MCLREVAQTLFYLIRCSTGCDGLASALCGGFISPADGSGHELFLSTAQEIFSFHSLALSHMSCAEQPLSQALGE